MVHVVQPSPSGYALFYITAAVYLTALQQRFSRRHARVQPGHAVVASPGHAAVLRKPQAWAGDYRQHGPERATRREAWRGCPA